MQTMSRSEVSQPTYDKQHYTNHVNELQRANNEQSLNALSLHYY